MNKVCELSYIGLTDEKNLEKGLEPIYSKTAILTAWDKRRILKLKVNTCTLDHKNALPLYQKLDLSPLVIKTRKG